MKLAKPILLPGILVLAFVCAASPESVLFTDYADFIRQSV